MTMPTTFCHVINPFPCPENSEHGIASRITYESLRVAAEEARKQGIRVEIHAIVLPGDEIAIKGPATLAGYLDRTVQDIRPMSPKRPFPLIADILRVGAESSECGYLIFTNMDIAVQPNFYVALNEIVEKRFEPGTPFTIYRRNISSHYDSIEQLPEMYRQPGQIAYGYDCFVFPKSYVPQLDLGNCCIGAAHFDYLLFIALDAVSGFRAQRINDLPLTFHIGNDIAWSSQIDYIEHNLMESLAAIRRMRGNLDIPQDSNFARMERAHFLPNTRIDSRLLRKLKRVPGIGQLALTVKRWLGRSH
ncbi:MAG: hypothetical protein HY018_04075 [Hydrogenophilales bacterium]|nr:hypothetical protein [Hydrogenophilales bacterium]